MIWLASFPRSGNTFFRIVLHQVYGIESGHLDPLETREDGWEKFLSYPVIKTHMQPKDLDAGDPNAPAVYIIRDGRDSIVSMAHHRKDIVAPGSNYLQNMDEAIRAEDGTFFGGWSRNVKDWCERAEVVIHFEELINDPIGNIEKLRGILDLPNPDIESLPTFEDLQKKRMPYQGQRNKVENWRKKFFRRGKSGSWKDEMPEPMQQLFWDLHGDTMEKFGYTEGCWKRPQPRKQKWYQALFNSKF